MTRQTPFETWLWLHELGAKSTRANYGIEVFLGTGGWLGYASDPDIFLRDADPGNKDRFTLRLKKLITAEGGPLDREDIQANLFEGRQLVTEWLFTIEHPVSFTSLTA